MRINAFKEISKIANGAALSVAKGTQPGLQVNEKNFLILYHVAKLYNEVSGIAGDKCRLTNSERKRILRKTWTTYQRLIKIKRAPKNDR